MSSFKPKYFKTRTYGKWILSGEHAVLRGGTAIVFPLFSKWMEFQFIPHSEVDDFSNKNNSEQLLNTNPNKLKISSVGPYGSEVEFLIKGLFDKAFEILNIESISIFGEIIIDNQIPLGSGLGASSSLCVAFGRWFMDMGLVSANDVYDFSRKLENLFHGESSGVDIAVVLNEKPLLFQRPNRIELLTLPKLPIMFLSHTGQRGVTKDCIEKVKKIFESNPDLASKIDERMKNVSLNYINYFEKQKRQSVSHLKTNNNSENWNLGIQSNDEFSLNLFFSKQMDASYECFKEWGLSDGAVKTHIEKLLALGAVSCKPTGSGGGGYVLSLWNEAPILDKIPFDLIAINPTF